LIPHKVYGHASSPTLMVHCERHLPLRFLWVAPCWWFRCIVPHLSPPRERPALWSDYFLGLAGLMALLGFLVLLGFLALAPLFRPRPTFFASLLRVAA